MIQPAVDSDANLAELVRRLAEHFKPRRIYLFGSRARGDHGPDSDYDLLVLVDGIREPDQRLSRQAYKLAWELGTSADILVWPFDLFERRRHLRASLPGTVLAEGKLLYDAA